MELFSIRIRRTFQLVSTGHSAYTRKKLVEDMGKWGLKPIDRRNYERFRKVALALYYEQSLIDFSSFKGKQTYTIRTIIGD